MIYPHFQTHSYTEIQEKQPYLTVLAVERVQLLQIEKLEKLHGPIKIQDPV